jgi:hypothetical protein
MTTETIEEAMGVTKEEHADGMKIAMPILDEFTSGKLPAGETLYRIANMTYPCDAIRIAVVICSAMNMQRIMDEVKLVKVVNALLTGAQP